jgi:PPK2 family polyphosphate:nucleotide phosphotransferase
MSDQHKIAPQTPIMDVRTLDTHVQMDKEESREILRENKVALNELQEQLFSSRKGSVTFVFQAMDAAGKDSTIKAVFSGMNPQGFIVTGFKQPTKHELAHDYLWRVNKHLPPKGRIGVFNRSHYEEVLVCKVHPEYVVSQGIPGIRSVSDVDEAFWNTRYAQINNFEKHLADNGHRMVKFFLNVSLDEQKERFLSRMEEPHKHWKFSLGDLKERQHWHSYMDAYSKAISTTSTDYAPWHVIPADDKDYMRAAVSKVIRSTMEDMKLSFPKVDASDMLDIAAARVILEEEKLN